MYAYMYVYEYKSMLFMCMCMRAYACVCAECGMSPDPAGSRTLTEPPEADSLVIQRPQHDILKIVDVFFVYTVEGHVETGLGVNAHGCGHLGVVLFPRLV